MVYPVAQPVKSPFETLMTVRPFQVVEFLDGVSAIRNVLTSRNHSDSILVTPLRGALPLLWASEGATEIEHPLPVQPREIPLGLFWYANDNGKTGTTSPTYEQKTGLLRNMFATLDDDEVRRMLLLDEVQKGGTLSTATRIIQSILRANYPSYKLSVSLHKTPVCLSCASQKLKYMK